ncbi:sister chromatid cohesion protein PDS5 homolog A-like [Rutidosis leptorrhynchoides]|uniref:sister chromatid cohesion protein PDS5 homolog A-like n=1 Tax=Rutidosis leptorrhynchoides TaxID=125765 RepID=UPI003A995E45
MVKLLKEVGSKLQNLYASTDKDALINVLTQAATCLTEMDQSPPKTVMESMQPLLKTIVKPELLKHQDEQVKLLVASCTCEITRITAPEAPYDDDVLKDIFHLFVSTFSGLKDTKDPSFERRVNVLDVVAKYRSFVVMLDLECDDLVNEMFKTFFAVVSDEHTETVTLAMETIMAVLLEESEEIGEDLLVIILSFLGRDKKDINTAARKLAMKVIGQCSEIIEPSIKKFVISSMSEDESSSIHQIDSHEVIYDIYSCAPQILSDIVPYLTKELLTDKLELRLKTVKLLGDLFALPGVTIPQTFHPIFTEFLKRSTDSIVEVRMSVLEHIKLCLVSDPIREEAPKLVSVLGERLLDEDESIRKQAVAVISDVASRELSSISTDTIKLVSERLQDKSLLLKKYTMERLSDIYRTWCLKKIGDDDYDWIPGKILTCVYDNDLGLDTVEQILRTSLFPVECSVRDKVKIWVRLFSKFDKTEVKALEKILEQQQRLQLEVQKYISLREMYKDNDTSELQKKTTVCIRSMSQCFIDPAKAETDFQALGQSKDANIWRILTTLVDPSTSSLQSRSLRDELLKIVGEKEPLYLFLSSLSLKCSYTIFDKEFVKELLIETDLQKSDGSKLLTQSCLNILVILACFSPLLLSGIEENLVHLLEDDDEAIKEGVLHVLAKAGDAIREQLGESSSSLDLMLERICLEGNRRQAKYAVHSLAAITKDEGLKSLSVLYKRLVDTLEKRTNLPSVLQSLGCIAQTATPVFETQESKVVNFITNEILRCSQKTGANEKHSWDERSELCSLKIFGLKTLVKSYLPVKDAHLRVGIDELIKHLQYILSFGEISKDVESSSVDKAHLKLASAKAIIRLSKHWDKKIPIDVFHLTLRISEAEFPQARKLFLNKVRQYISDRSLDPKYVCAFLLNSESDNSILEEENRNLSDIIQTSGTSPVIHAEYVLPYLIHALAHHPSCPNIDECKDAKAYEPIYRKLYMFLSKFVHGDDGKPGICLKREDITSITSVLRSIKKSVDVVDTNVSKNSYAICELCLHITKRLAPKQDDLYEPSLSVSLPDALYAPIKKKEDNNEDDKKEEHKEDDKKEEHKEDDKKEENKEDDKTEEIKEDNKKNEIKEDDKKEDNKEDEKKKEIEKDKEEEKKEDDKKAEIDTEVSEGQTWLADENALAHFESLILEANGMVTSKTIEDDIMQDIEIDGKEMSLGKMLQRIKAKGSKARKIVNNGSTPAVVEPENNVDILGMLKEINSDNLDVPNKFDSSNGHGKISMEAKLKRKGISNDLPTVPVPKRQRSSSAKGQKRSSFLKGGPDFIVTKMDEDAQSGLEDKVKSTNSDEVDLEKPKKSVKTENNQKSGPVRKRKRRRISGLAKGTSEEIVLNNKNLVGRHIRVWWPMDKAFYKGVVKSYDHQTEKHVVSYDDGDVEVLCLDKERWEFVEDEHKPAKRKRLSNSPSSKGGSSKKIIKSAGSSKHTKESSNISPSSAVRGKRTPRKNLKQGQKGVSQRAAYLEMGSSKNIDFDTEMKDAESSSSDPVSSQENKSGSGHKQTEKFDTISNEGSGSNKNSESHKADESDSEENQENSAESRSTDAAPTPNDSDKSEFVDDEPLGVWKSRIRKTVKGK